MSLKELVTQIISKFRNEHLNVIMHEFEWLDVYSEWQSFGVKDTEYERFYHLELSLERNQYEVKCIDATHILTRQEKEAVSVA